MSNTLEKPQTGHSFEEVDPETLTQLADSIALDSITKPYGAALATHIEPLNDGADGRPTATVKPYSSGPTGERDYEHDRD